MRWHNFSEQNMKQIQSFIEWKFEKLNINDSWILDGSNVSIQNPSPLSMDIGEQSINNWRQFA